MTCPHNHGAMVESAGWWLCPICGTTLREDALSVDPGATLRELPSIVAIPLAEFFRETHPTVKLYLLWQAIEVLTKFLAVLCIADCLRLSANSLPPEVVAALRPAIERPTLGQ